MKVKLDKILVLEVLIILLTVNYMVVTILLNDTIVLKYLRDIILLCLFGVSVFGKKVNKYYIGWLLFFILLIFSFFNSDNTSLAFVSIRKYVFPILALITLDKFTPITKDNLLRLMNFLLRFFALISFWGIFQAWVLKDDFLKQIGYPTSYSYSYGRDMLNYSFYFGGLGIQRVVSTLSNSNVFGLIVGATLIVTVFLYPYITNKRKNFYIILMAVGYMLTFSRSNYLALLIVIISSMYPYLPHKNWVWTFIGSGLVSGIVLSVVQGENGLVNKLIGWVVNSLNFSDSSVAGRSVRWIGALNESLANPLGIGFGHVGSLAYRAGVSNVFDSENSYLAIALDAGIFGLMVYLSSVIIVIMRFMSFRKQYTEDNSFAKRICLSGKSLLVYMLVVMFFSNHIYDMEAIALIYIYAGMLLNMLRNNIDNEFEAI